MLSTNLDVTFSMVWILVIANLISILFAFALLRWLVGLTRIKELILIPIILTLVWLGAFSNLSNFGDLVLLAVSGAFGYAMVVLNWPRPPLVLGLVLGTLADKNLGIAYQRYGYDFFTDPTVVVIFGLAFASLLYALIQNRRIAQARANTATRGGNGA